MSESLILSTKELMGKDIEIVSIDEKIHKELTTHHIKTYNFNVNNMNKSTFLVKLLNQIQDFQVILYVNDIKFSKILSKSFK